jgi:L-alanine-DL-glutamate epimerase-like enolase superfamily enzyme
LESTVILDSTILFEERPLVVPLVLSSGTITVITEATAAVTVRVGGRTATGRGSIFLSDLWAWPEASLSHEQRDAALRELCTGIARDLRGLCGGAPAHPLELGLRLHESICESRTPPVLARAMCASPFDAAIHDAAGLARGCSAFRFYDEAASLPSAAGYFDIPPWQAIRRVITAPRRHLRAWYVVGKNDGPDQLAPWVRERGYHCLKIKLPGHDAVADASRTSEVFRMARQLGAADIQLSVDTNEANPDADSVLAYLRELQECDPQAYGALAYLEQPTNRDIAAYAFDWRPVCALKPVMLDEGLTGLEQMHTAREQGWSGFAIKTCKGHSFALTCAAWADQNRLPISLQDLTNPGLSMIHAAWFAAHVRTINDVELNSPQFTPDANSAWLKSLPGLFDPRNGQHVLPDSVPPGLGSEQHLPHESGLCGH